MQVWGIQGCGNIESTIITIIILHTVIEMKLSCFCMHLYVSTPTLLLAAKGPPFMILVGSKQAALLCTFFDYHRGGGTEMQLK